MYDAATIVFMVRLLACSSFFLVKTSIFQERKFLLRTEA